MFKCSFSMREHGAISPFTAAQLTKAASERHHPMTRRFFDPAYSGHPGDDHDVALYEEAWGVWLSVVN